MAGKLFLVATPIGNLDDISRRALETLEAVDLIACEDTRRTGRLLKHFGISKKLISYHEHNEEERAAELAEMLARGRSIAVVSDAGTPGISDPAFRIVRTAHENGAQVIPVPGPAAFVSAAVISGLPTDSIFFGGFLPSKKGDRRRRLEEVREIPATLVFYETPHRLARSLTDCLEILGNRRAAVVRELTKLYEETVVGKLKELMARFSERAVKGEIVLVIDRQSARQEKQSPNAAGQSLSARVKKLESEGLDHKKALKKAAREFGLSRSEAYRRLHLDDH